MLRVTASYMGSSPVSAARWSLSRLPARSKPITPAYRRTRLTMGLATLRPARVRHDLSSHLDVGFRDHSGPAIEVLLDEGRELFRRAAHDLHAQSRQTLLHLGMRERLQRGAMQLGDHACVHACWPDQARYVEDLEV